MRQGRLHTSDAFKWLQMCCGLHLGLRTISAGWERCQRCNTVEGKDEAGVVLSSGVSLRHPSCSHVYIKHEAILLQTLEMLGQTDCACLEKLACKAFSRLFKAFWWACPSTKPHKLKHSDAFFNQKLEYCRPHGSDQRKYLFLLAPLICRCFHQPLFCTFFVFFYACK